MALIWSDRGGWSMEEEELLYARFGDDTTLDIVSRSPVDPRVVVTWVAWDRQHPSIYLVDFRNRTRDGYVAAEEYMTIEQLRDSAWGEFFPPVEGAPEEAQ